MRVLHVLDHSIPIQTGYTFRTRAILEQQRRLGWDTVHLTSSKHDGASREEEEVDALHFYRTLRGNSLLERLPVLNQYAVIRKLARRMRGVVRIERPDILHAHSPCLNGIAALRVRRRFKVPVVYELRASWEDAAVNLGTTRHGSLRYRLSRALETYVLKRADAVVTICEGLKQDILRRGLRDADVTVVPNAVNPERFKCDIEADSSLLKALGLENKRVLGFIGSFNPYEGLSLLIEAMPNMVKFDPQIRLLLVGGGLQEQELRRLAARLGVADKVIFAGRVPHDEVQKYYDLANVFVYPRLSMRLTELVTPLKPLEAMAKKRLVVASDVAGHRELIEDGKTGILFRAGDAGALVDALLGLLNHPERWPALQETARRFVERERTWEAAVSRYEPIYQRLVSAGAPIAV